LSARTGVPQRIVEAVAIPVETLRIGRVRHNGVRADEPPYRGIVIPCIVKVKAGLVKPLAGEELIGIQRSRH